MQVTDVIYKYPFSHQFLLGYDHFVMPMPKGAKIVHFDAQGENLCIWAIVDPSAEMVDREFWIVGTGQPLLLNTIYIGTSQFHDFVWHLFETEN